MSDEDQKKPEIPHRMNRIAFPSAKYGIYLAIIIIVVVLLIFYRDLIF
jgi:predicted RND superfamily exporter protein